MLSTSIIVVGFGGETWLPPLLRSLQLSVRRFDELIIVDNGGNGSSIPSMFSDCGLTVLRTPHRMGFCDANNFALDRLQPCELVCFLNQDVVVDTNWLISIDRVFCENSIVGAASPVHMTYDFRRINPNFRSTLRPSRLTMHKRCASGSYFQCDNLIAAAMFVRRSVLEEIGGFDPIFGSYCEDYDLCRRIRQAGFQTVVVPASRIGHFDGSATRSLAAVRRRELQTVRNWAILNTRRAPSRITELARQFLIQFPRRLINSLLRRTGCKHPTSILQAYASLMTLAPRLASDKRDAEESEKHWVNMKARMRDVGNGRRTEG